MKRNKKIARAIRLGKKAAFQTGRTLVAATFRKVAEQNFVRISVPDITAKYLKAVPGHGILIFDDDLKNVVEINVGRHMIHGDFPAKTKDGKCCPRVIRHFYVDPAYCGQTIAAKVEIKEKTDLETGRITIMVDIFQRFKKRREGEEYRPLETQRVLRLGVPATGSADEAVIPGTELCVRIEAAKPQPIAIENSDPDMRPVKPEEAAA